MRMIYSIVGSRRVAELAVCVMLAFLNMFWPGRAYGHGDTHAKLEHLSRVISNETQSAELFLQRGQIHAQHGDWDEAISDYERAERLEPDIEHVDLLLGKALRQSQRFEDAVNRLDRYIIKHPDSAGAFLARARTHADARHVDPASRDFARVAELAPNPDAYVEWANLLIGTNRAEEAIQRLEEGCNALGPLITLQVKIIDIEIAREKYDRALERIDAILANAPRKESWLARKGDLLARAGQPTAAADAYAHALVALRRLPSRHRLSTSMQTLEKSLKQKLDHEKNKVNP
jgi:predicted Zn-dependent protease